MTKDFSDTVVERLAKDPAFAREVLRELGEQTARADRAEAQIAEAVRECERIADEAKYYVFVDAPQEIRNRYPEYFNEDA